MRKIEIETGNDHLCFPKAVDVRSKKFGLMFYAVYIANLAVVGLQDTTT
jgi:hypothetical protein